MAFAPVRIETTLAEQISLAGLRQAHVAETEKFAHATFFLNGGRQTPYDNENDILIPSRKDVATHDLAPKMRAAEIAAAAIEQLEQGVDFIFVNFANADMVGHTADREALIDAVEEVDFQMDRLVDKLTALSGTAIISADHGNAEQYYDPVTDTRHTAHTSNLVPFILTDKSLAVKSSGSLADIAPTVLELFGIDKPGFMTGTSLIVKKD